MRFVMRRDSGTADAINRSFERSRSSVGWAERVGRLLPWLRRGGGAERAGGYGSRVETYRGRTPSMNTFLDRSHDSLRTITTLARS